MCAGVMIQSRLKTLVYATKDWKWGTHTTKCNLFEQNLFNHNVACHYIEDDRFGLLLTRFFASSLGQIETRGPPRLLRHVAHSPLSEAE